MQYECNFSRNFTVKSVFYPVEIAKNRHFDKKGRIFLHFLQWDKKGGALHIATRLRGVY